MSIIEIPTDKSHKFLSLTSLFIFIFTLFIPHFYSIYTQNQITLLRLKADTIKEEITFAELELDSIIKKKKNKKSMVYNFENKLMKPIKTKINDLKLIESEINTLKELYKEFLSIRSVTIWVSGIIFLLSTFFWIILDYKEYHSNN